MATDKSILFVDAYDSFSQNIIALLHQEIGVGITLIDIDTDVEERFDTRLDVFVTWFDAIVLGPGPGNPHQQKDSGILYNVIDAATTASVPVLGICLGFQVLCVKYGLPIDRMHEPCHGQPKRILPLESNHSPGDHDIFQGLDADNIWATCYNSLGLTLSNTLSSPTTSRPGSSGTNASFSTMSSQSSTKPKTALRVLSIDLEQNVMAIRHCHLPFWGVQFHPESCKSNAECRQLIRNWWSSACKHNEKNAAGRPSCKSYQQSTTSLSKVPLTPIADGILSQLLTVSTSSGQNVQWAKIEAQCSRTVLSELIYDISQQNKVVMLESTKKGRFSIYAVLEDDFLRTPRDEGQRLDSSWHMTYQQTRVSIVKSGSSTASINAANYEDVWNALQAFLIEKMAVGGAATVPFWGGFVGYLSYEHGLELIRVDSNSPISRSVAEINLTWVERSIVYDNLDGVFYVQSIRRNDKNFIDQMVALLSRPSTIWARQHTQSARQRSELQNIVRRAKINGPNKERYSSCFHECQAQLRAGNSYELCLTTETTVAIPKPSTDSRYEFELYKNLHAYNPVPFGAFLALPGVTILSTSPEQYMSWSRNGVIDMVPMKGTVKRSAEMTFEKASEILSSPKESAENLMIADLIRHDLYGTVGYDSKVEVVKLCKVIEHETVYQLVSHIRAHAPGIDGTDEDETQEQAIRYGLTALRQAMPPGSMTGAPKKRSCEILSKLEQRNRGVYSGVLGYMDVGGGGSWNVCIRTAFRYDGEDADHDIWHLGAGGAITVLSDVEAEWQEMEVKSQSVLQGFRDVK